jgi:hypothetical protein
MSLKKSFKSLMHLPFFQELMIVIDFGGDFLKCTPAGIPCTDAGSGTCGYIAGWTICWTT